MIAYLILLIAALTRFVPHALHGIGLNFTAVGGGLLCFGARRPRSLAIGWHAAIATAVLALTDLCLTTLVYGRQFHPGSYLITWAWYAGVCLLGSAMLRKVTALRVVVAVLASATGFFLLSNFAVWAGTQVTYPHTLAGLAACYAAGLPFYMNDIASTGLTAGALFGLPVLATRMAEMFRSAQNRNEPLA